MTVSISVCIFHDLVDRNTQKKTLNFQLEKCNNFSLKKLANNSKIKL